jgi:hypothetical protein
MARPPSQIRQLKDLLDRADALAGEVTLSWRRTVRDIRKEVAYMTSKLNVGKNAVNRERIIRQVQYHISRLSRRIARIEDSHLKYVAKTALRAARQSTGIRIEYSKERVDALMSLIKEQNGGSMAATFTRAMSRTAVTALRNAVVSAFREQAISGGTMAELNRSIRDRWDAIVGNDKNFRFVDRSGRPWETGRYIQMNVRANSMRLYNKQIVDGFVRANGSDLVRVSNDGRTTESCGACKKWAGRILSVSGKTKGFPTIQHAEDDGLFHPNCIHTLEAVMEGWDNDIEEQKAEYENGWEKEYDKTLEHSHKKGGVK